MKKQLAVAVLSVLTAFSGIVPAHAFPSVSAPKVETSSDIVQVRDSIGSQFGNRRWVGRNRGPGYNVPRYNRGGYYGRNRYYGNRYYGNRYYGNRYYRNRGPNVGAVIGGLAAGAIIGGALAQPRYVAPSYSSGSAHVNWCYARYRSYRAYDNTFQPNYGPRRQCNSPY